MTSPGRPARPDDDLHLVLGWRQGLGPLLAERWRLQGRKVILVVPRRPAPSQPLPPNLRLAVLDRSSLAAALQDLPALLARAEPWRKASGRPLHVPSSCAVHLLDLQVEGAEDLLGSLGGLGARPGRLLFLSDAALLGRGSAGRFFVEGDPLEEELPPRVAALRDAETVARQSRARGRIVVGLRLASYLYGPGLPPLTMLGPDPRLPDRLRRGDPILWVAEALPVQPLHVEDLGEALDALLGLPAPGPLYHLAGPETCGWDELLARLHRASAAAGPPHLEVLGLEELALRKPELARAFTELAWLPLLDDGLVRREVHRAERRLADHAPAWLSWCLAQLGPEG